MVPAYERMMAKVRKTDTCWLFEGALDQNGHGNVRVKHNGRWSCTKAHRIAYEYHHGAVPQGMVVRHMCDVRNCVRPEHVTHGTQKENVNDMRQRNRGANQHGPWPSPAVDDCPF